MPFTRAKAKLKKAVINSITFLIEKAIEIHMINLHK